jgi:hypothetical protein
VAKMSGVSPKTFLAHSMTNRMSARACGNWSKTQPPSSTIIRI